MVVLSDHTYQQRHAPGKSTKEWLLSLHINKLELDHAPSGLLALFAASPKATKDS
jgi:hypothetical protein